MQDKFLSRNKNKRNLIELLCEEFEKEKCSTVVAEEDADFLIVSIAEKSSVSGTTWIIGEDIDLLVILTQHAPINTVYFLKPGKGNANDCIYDSNSFKYLKVKKLICFLHAFTGCDTTSCFFKQGKNKLINTLSDDVVLQKKAQHFYNLSVNPDVLAASANDIVSQMYGSKNDKKTLRERRFFNFQKSALKGSLKLENLPPTEGATKQHAYRSYLRFQQ